MEPVGLLSDSLGLAKCPRVPDLKMRHVLGRGAFAVVLCAEERASGARVAVKVQLPPAQESGAQMFKAEAATMLRLASPKIVGCAGLITVPPGTPGLPKELRFDQPLQAMVLEFMEEGSLARLVCKQMSQPGRRLYSNREALSILVDVAEALCTMHNVNPPIVHRDLKMENVLLTRRNGVVEAKLADLGLHANLDFRERQSVLRRRAACAPPGAGVFFSRRRLTNSQAGVAPPPRASGDGTSGLVLTPLQGLGNTPATAWRTSEELPTQSATQTAEAVPDDRRMPDQQQPMQGMLALGPPPQPTLDPARQSTLLPPISITQSSTPSRLQHMATVADGVVDCVTPPDAPVFRQPHRLPQLNLLPASRIGPSCAPGMVANQHTLPSSDPKLVSVAEAPLWQQVVLLQSLSSRENTGEGETSMCEGAHDMVPLLASDVGSSDAVARPRAALGGLLLDNPVYGHSSKSGTGVSLTPVAVESPMAPLDDFADPAVEAGVGAPFATLQPLLARMVSERGRLWSMRDAWTTLSSEPPSTQAVLAAEGGDVLSSLPGSALAMDILLPRDACSSLARISSSTPEHCSLLRSDDDSSSTLTDPAQPLPQLHEPPPDKAGEGGGSVELGSSPPLPLPRPLPALSSLAYGSNRPLKSFLPSPVAERSRGFNVLEPSLSGSTSAAKPRSGMLRRAATALKSSLRLPHAASEPSLALSALVQVNSEGAAAHSNRVRGESWAELAEGEAGGNQGLPSHLSAPHRSISGVAALDDGAAPSGGGQLMDLVDVATQQRISVAVPLGPLQNLRRISSSPALLQNEKLVSGQQLVAPKGPRMAAVRRSSVGPIPIVGSVRLEQDASARPDADESPFATLSPFGAVQRVADGDSVAVAATLKAPRAAPSPQAKTPPTTPGRTPRMVPSTSASMLPSPGPRAPSPILGVAFRPPALTYDGLLHEEGRAGEARTPDGTAPSLGSGKGAPGSCGIRTGPRTPPQISPGDQGLDARHVGRMKQPEEDNHARQAKALDSATLKKLGSFHELPDKPTAINTIPSLRRSRNAEFAWVFNLTAETGSCMFMSPEVTKGEPYNETADIFSFGVLAYELLSRSMLVFTHVGAGRVADTPEGYAVATSQGYRPDKPNDMDEAVWALITSCWAQDPLERPTSHGVVASLKAILSRLPPDVPAAARCGCGCVVM